MTVSGPRVLVPRPLLIGLIGAAAGGAGCSEDRSGVVEERGAEELPPAGRDLLIPPRELLLPPSVQEYRRLKDPRADGFRSEVLHDLSKDKLERFLGALLLDEHPDADVLEPLLAEPFEGSTELRPARLTAEFERGGILVRRGQPAPERHGAGELGRLVSELLEPFDPEHFHHHFKTIDVRIEDERHFTTRSLVWIEGAQGTQAIQQSMEWQIGWWAAEGDGEVRIRSIEPLFFEEVVAARTLFADLTAQVFGSVPRFQQDFLRGANAWHERTDALVGDTLFGAQGIALGDVNGDGLDDVYVCQQGGVPNRLFLHGSDGTAVDATAASGLGFLENTRSALLLDLDGDGDQDVAFATGPLVVIGYNEGDGTFRDFVPLTCPDVPDVYSLSAADPDGDGDLDLYACRYAAKGILGQPPTPYHDANNGAPNVYWRNDGERRFADATAEVGLDHNNTKFSFASLWEDFDGDGDLDLYVANDFGRKNLYRNEGGRFRDVADEVGAADIGAGMGVTSADVDLDGDWDLYVSNMFSSAGRRIVPQSEHFMKEHPELHPYYQRHARGNSLLVNRGDGTFEDATDVARVAVGGWAWGAKFVDINNDGYEDIYSPDGFVTNEDPGDL